MLKNCIISKYDPEITSPPYLTIKLDEVKVDEPEIDDLGKQFENNLRIACAYKGYTMQFYTTSYEEGFDYEIVVYDI